MLKIEGELPQVVMELYKMFDDEGFELAIVGGWVRNEFLGIASDDIDLATNARPDDIIEIVSEWADQLWTVGREFGTIAILKYGQKIEITTYRADVYSESSRQPTVTFGDSLTQDLHRRDFTINAMAIMLPDKFFDPFGGWNDLQSRILRTPALSSASINDDPLRIYRAARFMAQFYMYPSYDLTYAIEMNHHKLAKVSDERISDELTKIMKLDNPSLGLSYLNDLGILDVRTDVLDWLIKNETSVSLPLRFAAIFADESVNEIHEIMWKMRFPKSLIRDVKKISEGAVKSSVVISDSQIRKLIMNYSNHMEDIIKLMNFSFRNFSSPYADRIREIWGKEDLSDPLSGNEIMYLLNVDGGPVIGEAIKKMRDYIAEHGPTSKLIIGNHLLNWHELVYN